MQHALVSMQEILVDLEGSLRQFIMDDKGTTLIGVFGLYPAHENDPHLATQCAMEMVKRLRRLDMVRRKKKRRRKRRKKKRYEKKIEKKKRKRGEVCRCSDSSFIVFVVVFTDSLLKIVKRFKDTTINLHSVKQKN